MSSFTLVYRLRLRPLLVSFRRASRKRRLGVSLSAVFGSVIFLVILALSSELFGGTLGSEASGRVAAGAANVFVLGAFIYGITFALGTMYFSRDLEVLRSLPIRERTIFSYKFWEILLGISSLFVAVVVPILLAYGLASGASFLFYPVLLAVLVAVPMVPTALCILAVMPLVRVIPAGRVKGLAAAVGILAAMVFLAVQSVLSGPLQPFGSGPAESLRALSKVPLLNVPPGLWTSQALSGAASLQSGRLFGGLLPLLALSLGLYAVCVWVSDWAYATGTARMKESDGKIKTSGWWAWRAVLAWLPQDVRAVVLKDLSSLFRDPRRLVSFVVFAIGGIAVSFSASRGNSDGPGTLPYVFAGWWVTIFSTMVLNQSVGIEGRSYWVVAASPLSPRRLLAGKWISAIPMGILTILVACVGILAVSGFHPLEFVIGLAAGTVMFSLTALYAIGFAAIYSNFNWDNPNQASSPWAKYLSVASGFGMMIVGLLAFGLGALLLRLVGTPAWLAVTCAITFWLVCTAIPGYMVISAGARHLKRVQWKS